MDTDLLHQMEHFLNVTKDVPSEEQESVIQCALDDGAVRHAGCGNFSSVITRAIATAGFLPDTKGCYASAKLDKEEWISDPEMAYRLASLLEVYQEMAHALLDQDAQTIDEARQHYSQKILRDATFLLGSPNRSLKIRSLYKDGDAFQEVLLKRGKEALPDEEDFPIHELALPNRHIKDPTILYDHHIYLDAILHGDPEQQAGALLLTLGAGDLGRQQQGQWRAPQQGLGTACVKLGFFYIGSC